MTGPLVVAANLTMDGSGHSIVLDGAGQFSIISVNPGITFAVNHVAFHNGSAGSGASAITLVFRRQQMYKELHLLFLPRHASAGRSSTYKPTIRPIKTVSTDITVTQ